MTANVQILRPRRIGDERGWFMETCNPAMLAAAGVTDVFVQDNHSYSKAAGVIRGIHFQRPPHAQAKLVRCLRGAMMDYAVDLRRGSPTYGRYVGVELSAENALQLYIPAGFGHAFITLEPDVEIAYRVSDVYAADCDGGLAWNDPTIAIAWPLAAGQTPILSAKDAALPPLVDFDSPFAYDGGPLAPLQLPPDL